MKKLLLAFFVLAILSFNVFAVKVSSLYTAELPVSSQSSDVKDQAVQDGFYQVLVKLSGDSELNKNPLIKNSLKRADYYVQEVSYSAATMDSSLYLIKIRYDADDINRLLKKAGITCWGETRPLILVWLSVMNKGQNAQIIDSETPGEIFSMIKQQAKRFGLPLILPMMDMTDMNQVTAADITNVALTPLKQAGKRYAPDALLIGNLDETDTGTQSQWQLILGNDSWKWKLTDKSTTDNIASLVNLVSQALIKHYAVDGVSATAPLWVKLEVENVVQGEDLKKLMDYLKRLSIVQQIRLAQVSGDVVELSVLVQGSLAAFQQNASIGQHLVLKSQDASDNSIVYQWVR